MKDWRFHLAEQRGTLLALAVFVAMFGLYVANHPAGFTANVVQTVANKGVLLAFVAMAQTLVVLTSGIDLSVGMVFILCNCLASYLVAGSGVATTFGVVGVIATGALCGAINAVIVIFGRLQPIVTTIATGAVYFGIALWIRPFPGSSTEFNSDFADALTGKVFDLIPASVVVLLGVVVLVWLPFQRSVIGRTAYAVGSSELGAYMSGMPIRRAKFAAYVLAGVLASIGGLFLTFFTYLGRSVGRERQHLHAVFHRGGGAGRRVPVRRPRQRHRRDFRRLCVPRHRRSAVRVRRRSIVAAAVPGRGPAARGLDRLGSPVPGAQPSGTVHMKSEVSDAPATPARRDQDWRQRIDVPVATAFGCILLLLALGSIYSSNFLSPEYLLQQLKVGAFLGVIATGMMLVILLGQIDLSVPWTVTLGAMMASATAAHGAVGEVLAIPVGVACGVLIGLVNGIGVAYLRIPSMIVTLAVNAVAQGLMVAYTGGFAPGDSASSAMRYLAAGTILGVPNAAIMWAVDRRPGGVPADRAPHSAAPSMASATRKPPPISPACRRSASS